MIELLVEKLKAALSSQDWVVVAKTALELQELQYELDTKKMESYYAQEETDFIAEANRRAFGHIISLSGSTSKKRG